MRPALDVQLKATINLGKPDSGFFHFSLPTRNYDLLRVQTAIPRILVVLDLPTVEDEWLHISPEELILRRCAYWISLASAAQTDNTTSVTVPLDNSQRFDVDTLRELMEKARTGGPI